MPQKIQKVYVCYQEEHCIADDTADWKIRYSDKVLEEESSEDFHILQRVADPTEASPKRKRDIVTADKEVIYRVCYLTIPFLGESDAQWCVTLTPHFLNNQTLPTNNT